MELRATADAVMAGARTIEMSAATLSPGGKKFQRLCLSRGLAEYNLRVIVSGNDLMNLRAPIFKQRFSPIIVLAPETVPEKNLRQLLSVADEVKCFGKKEIDFPAALRWLREKWQVKRLLCEGGGRLHGTMIRAGLINELNLTICPQIFGGRHAPTIAEGGHVVTLAHAAQFRFKSAKRFGDELFVIFTAVKSGQC